MPTGTVSCSAIHTCQEPQEKLLVCLGHALHCGLQQDAGWDRVRLPAPGAGTVGPHVSLQGCSSLSLTCFRSNVTAMLDNNDRRRLSEGKRLVKKASITLCSFGTGNGKTFAHLPHYPCYQHRRFPWQRCIQAPSSRSGRHTASCSDPACISHCHCTNQGSHLVEEMEKVSTSTLVHTAAQTPDTLLCRQKGSFLLVG